MIKIMGPKRRKREAYIKRKKKKRAFVKKAIRRSIILFCLAGILIAAWICLKLTLNQIFYVRNITVTGNSHYEENEIITASGIQKGNNLLFVNSKNSEEEIYNKLPYVEKVGINKKWPGSIEINITTGSPCYFI